jgi:hypothetical protein
MNKSNQRIQLPKGKQGLSPLINIKRVQNNVS